MKYRLNSAGIHHIADSNYCFALNKEDLVIRFRMAREDEKTAVYIIYGMKYEYQDHRFKKEMMLKYKDDNYCYFEIELKLSDSRLAYIFELNIENQTYYYSEEGLSRTYDFSKGFYNFFQMPYLNPVDIYPTVGWMKKSVFYQIFVDRFCRGDFTKDDTYINLSWGGTPTPSNFAGGDLKGIINKLTYLKDLGINAIYLTPIFLSPSNHKYDIVDYYKVDPQFGTNNDLKNLVTKAHQLGMRVILDAVFNHCSMLSREFQDVIRKGRQSKYYHWFIIDGDFPDIEKTNYECFASCNYMPKWNTSNSEVQRFLTDIGVYWIEKYDIDGWRLDVSDEVSHQFWRTFRIAVKKVKKECVLIGENWHNAGSFLHGDQFDGIMNYSFTKICLDCFAESKLTADKMANRLNNILMRYSLQTNQMNLNLLDSHDTHRIFTELKEDKNKLLAALALSFVFIGTPCIYYGTEIAMQGGYDPDSRRTFDWNEKERNQYLFNKIKEIIQLRRLSVLQEGSISIECKENQLLIHRIFNNEQLNYQLNLSKGLASLLISGNTVISNGVVENKLDSFGYYISICEAKIDEKI
ncbi:glycoside hydrolase family 13 protein [Enterococcus cecorum]|uniref:glycoside hydrolase family 13 protein n=1 Tax=Enterococcus cecorum TaxID=44008 RepID=UPI003265DEC9